MIEIIQQRLDRYQAKNALEEEQALKEILQEVALYSLWRSGFFNVAAFQGGTSLRILHHLPRFSEDLDFILLQPDAGFSWENHRATLIETFAECGLDLTIADKSHMDRRVRQAVLKNDAIANQLTIAFQRPERRPALKIKLEIDTHPPVGSDYAWSYLDFPLDYEVRAQDLPSNFALKLHALLCRPYLKGRDWYDFSWYVSHKIQPNYHHLQAALHQHGPWKKQPLPVDRRWLTQQLLQKIAAIDWQAAIQDVERFLDAPQRQSLALWGAPFFTHKIGQI